MGETGPPAFKLGNHNVSVPQLLGCSFQKVRNFIASSHQNAGFSIWVFTNFPEVIPPDPHSGRGSPPALNTQPGLWLGAGRKRPGVRTQTLVSLSFSAVVAPMLYSAHMSTRTVVAMEDNSQSQITCMHVSLQCSNNYHQHQLLFEENLILQQEHFRSTDLRQGESGWRIHNPFAHNGRIQRWGVRGPCPPNRRLSGFFLRKTRLCWDCSLYQKCSVDLKYAKNALAARAQPQTLLGELTTSDWEGDTPSQSPPLDSRAFGAQLLCPPM